jgi:KTSC domain
MPSESCENVQSSCIASMSYDGKEQMTLTFQSGGTYKYHGVGPDEYEAFCRAESKGKYFHRNIRGRYPFVRVGG